MSVRAALVAMLGRYDDDAWVALASKGCCGGRART